MAATEGLQDGRALREINALRNQLRDLTLKFDNQGVVLRQTEEELRDVRGKFRKLKTEQADNGDGGAEAAADLRRQLADKGKELMKALSQLESVTYEKTELSTQLERLKEKVDQMRNESKMQAGRMDVMRESLSSVKAVALQYEEENRGLYKSLKEYQRREEDLRNSLSAKDEILGSLETEAKMIGKQKNDMNAARRETNRSRRQLLLLAENTNRVQSEMHAAVMGHKHLLDELKSEYEEHTETVRAEWNMDRRAKMAEFNKLQQQFENLKLIQFEDKQQLLREQREVVKALQTQFQEYRQTAEFLFATEARKLEDKLQMQMEKYEEEIKYIVRAKDQHFDLMMTAKDAKIMNLIEGTDLQTLLIKHEQEMEQLRRAHLDDLDDMRLQTEATQRDTIQELRKEIASSELAQEALKLAIARLEEQVAQANDLNARRVEQMSQRAERHEKELNDMQLLLQESHEARERLNQEKQDLRHRIVRLRFKAKGDADETLPNLVKRLSMETSALKSKHGALTKKLGKTLQELKREQQKTMLTTQFLEQVSSQAESKEKELREMCQTLSKLLYIRIHGKFGTGPKEGRGAKPNAAKQHAAEHNAVADRMSLRRAVGLLQQVLDGDLHTVDAAEVTQDESPEPGGTEIGPADCDVEPAADAAERSDATGRKKKKRKPVRANVKARVPAKLRALLEGDAGEGEVEKVDRAEVLELARGISYVKRFQKLNHSFHKGAFQPLPEGVAASTAAPVGGASGSEDRNEVYTRLNTIDSGPDYIVGQREEWWKGNPLYEALEPGAAPVSVADRNASASEPDAAPGVTAYRPQPPNRAPKATPAATTPKGPPPPHKPRARPEPHTPKLGVAPQKDGG